MDGTIVFLTTGIIGGIFMWGILSHHMTLPGKILMFWVCYVGSCFFIAFYTGQDVNSVLLAPLTLLTPAQNQTIMAQAGNISVGNATTTFQSGNNTYGVVNLTADPSNTSWLNGTVMDPNNPLSPMTLLASALLIPFQSPWGIIIQIFTFTTFVYFMYSWVWRPMRRRNEYYRDYDPPSSETTRPPDPPQPQPPAQQPPTQGTGGPAEQEEKKPEKRDRYEVIKV